MTTNTSQQSHNCSCADLACYKDLCITDLIICYLPLTIYTFSVAFFESVKTPGASVTGLNHAGAWVFHRTQNSHQSKLGGNEQTD